MGRNNLQRPRACGYVRVSTDDQATHGTSIPSQIKKIEEFCRANNFELVQIFEEPGMSGKDENRPKFRSMLDKAVSAQRPYDMIVVNNLARFARNLAIQSVAYNKLEVAGVQLLSITENFAKGPDGNLMRSILGAFNQNVSDQSSRNTIRTMNLNAAEGFWNGGPIPFGYESFVVEKRGDKGKKKLRINETEAELVRCTFRLARFGEGAGPMGARNIAKWLNERGYTLRGGRFYNSNVAGILGRTHYAGYYEDAKKNEFKEPIPEEDWVRVPCPAIVTEEDYLEVAALRAKRSPKVTAPRVVNGVTMLPGSIARCGQPNCGEALTPRSGKGGQYYYYTCSARANRGASACDLQAIRRDELDGIVLGSLESFIFDSDRLRVILGHLLDRSDETEKRRRKDLGLAKSTLTNVTKAITNLIVMIESGAMLPTDALFVDRMAYNRAKKRTLEADILALERQLSVSKKRITDETIKAFACKMAEALESGDPRFRAAYVRLFVERVDVSAAEIKISGTKTALERALIDDGTSQNGLVPFFDRKWCPEEDSNLHAVASAST